MKHVIGYGRGETSQGLLIFAAVYDPKAPEFCNARILRFCDQPCDVERPSQHNLFFDGNILELGFMALKRLDPSMPMKAITPADYDYPVVREMYEQVIDWISRRLAKDLE